MSTKEEPVYIQKDAAITILAALTAPRPSPPLHSETLRALNGFLDELLATLVDSLLRRSRALSPSALRAAIHALLPVPSLAADATALADRAIQNASSPTARGWPERSEAVTPQGVYERLRVICGYYRSEFPDAAASVTGPTAGYVACLLEFVGRWLLRGSVGSAIRMERDKIRPQDLLAVLDGDEQLRAPFQQMAIRDFLVRAAARSQTSRAKGQPQAQAQAQALPPSSAPEVHHQQQQQQQQHAATPSPARSASADPATVNVHPPPRGTPISQGNPSAPVLGDTPRRGLTDPHDPATQPPALSGSSSSPPTSSAAPLARHSESSAATGGNKMQAFEDLLASDASETKKMSLTPNRLKAIEVNANKRGDDTVGVARGFLKFFGAGPKSPKAVEKKYTLGLKPVSSKDFTGSGKYDTDDADDDLPGGLHGRIASPDHHSPPHSRSTPGPGPSPIQAPIEVEPTESPLPVAPVARQPTLRKSSSRLAVASTIPDALSEEEEGEEGREEAAPARIHDYYSATGQGRTTEPPVPDLPVEEVVIVPAEVVVPTSRALPTVPGKLSHSSPEAQAPVQPIAQTTTEAQTPETPSAKEVEKIVQVEQQPVPVAVVEKDAIVSETAIEETFEDAVEELGDAPVIVEAPVIIEAPVIVEATPVAEVVPVVEAAPVVVATPIVEAEPTPVVEAAPTPVVEPQAETEEVTREVVEEVVEEAVVEDAVEEAAAETIDEDIVEVTTEEEGEPIVWEYESVSKLEIQSLKRTHSFLSLFDLLSEIEDEVAQKEIVIIDEKVEVATTEEVGTDEVTTEDATSVETPVESDEVKEEVTVETPEESEVEEEATEIADAAEEKEEEVTETKELAPKPSYPPAIKEIDFSIWGEGIIKLPFLPEEIRVALLHTIVVEEAEGEVKADAETEAEVEEEVKEETETTEVVEAIESADAKEAEAEADAEAEAEVEVEVETKGKASSIKESDSRRASLISKAMSTEIDRLKEELDKCRAALEAEKAQRAELEDLVVCLEEMQRETSM